MNAEDFLKEALLWEDCPKDFPEIYQRFQTYQREAMSTLKEFHRICEKNKIEYQLAYGSLLGAVRDGGQVPWDYDTDVIVAIEDKERLIKALETDLDSQFYYYCPEKDPLCRHVILRLAPVNYRTEALHLDVFYLTGSPEDAAERAAFVKKMKRVCERRYGKLLNAREEAAGNFNRFLLLLYKYKLPAFFHSLAGIEKEYSNLSRQYSTRNSTICVAADSYADWCEYPGKYMWETMLIDTMYGPLRIPVHYKELLEIYYGDYTSIPPIQQRVWDITYHSQKIAFFNKLD